MDLTEGSKTSAIINQTPRNYPKESLLHNVELIAVSQYDEDDGGWSFKKDILTRLRQGLNIQFSLI